MEFKTSHLREGFNEEVAFQKQCFLTGWDMVYNIMTYSVEHLECSYVQDK